MNINATEDDSRARVPLEHTQTDADRRGKKMEAERKSWTRKGEHASRVSPSETAEPGKSTCRLYHGS